MRLTPADIQAITFQRAAMGRRGYDEAHVDAVFGQIQHEIVQLLSEKTQLSEEVARLRQRVYGESVGDAELGVRPQDAHIQAVRILSKAQQTADRYVADAEEYGRQLAKDARRGRDEILAEAKARALLILEEAHQQADRAAAAAVEAAAQNGRGAPAEQLQRVEPAPSPPAATDGQTGQAHGPGQAGRADQDAARTPPAPPVPVIQPVPPAPAGPVPPDAPDQPEHAGGPAQAGPVQDAGKAGGVAPDGPPSTPGPPRDGADPRSLEQEITYLRTFSEVYRQQLRSYLEALLRNIGEWERSERSAPGPDDLARLEGAAYGQAAADPPGPPRPPAPAEGAASAPTGQAGQASGQPDRSAGAQPGQAASEQAGQETPGGPAGPAPAGESGTAGSAERPAT